MKANLQAVEYVNDMFYMAFSCILIDDPWPQHMREITGLGIVQLLDCTLHLHQQWYKIVLQSVFKFFAFNRNWVIS